MMDESNGDFEMVDKITSLAVSHAESSGVSVLTNIPPPSALPTFITAQAVAVRASDNKNIPLPVEPEQKLSRSEPFIPPSKILTLENKVDSKIPQVVPVVTPVTNQPLPPTIGASIEQGSYSSVNLISTDQSTNSASDNEGVPENDGWMGWIKGTVNAVGHKVAERAKSSMDSMITTLDPQMKEFINSGGDIDIIVASDKEVKISPIKEAFQKVFGKATVSGFASQSGEMAAQPVGFESVIKSAEERINTLRASGKIHPQQPVVAIENFIAQFTGESWVEMGVLLLDDPWHDIILQTYTQPVPIPDMFIQDLKSSTPENYPLKESGFSKTIGQAASEHLHVHHTMWQETLTGIPRREYILMAAKVLAQLYRTRLPSDVI